MKALNKGSSFFICLVFNLVVNLGWTIPAWILLALHHFLGWDIMWFWIALGAWLVITVFWMIVISFAARCGNKRDEPRENKNPYSAKNISFPGFEQK